MARSWEEIGPELSHFVQGALSRSDAPWLPCRIEEVIDTLCRVVVTPVAPPELGRLDSDLRDALPLALQMEPVDALRHAKAVTDAAVALESLGKKIILLTEPGAYERLAARREKFNLGACLGHLGVAWPEQVGPEQYDALPGLASYVEWAYDTRNHVHSSPRWDAVERGKRIHAVATTIVYLVASRLPALEAALFLPTVRGYLATLQRNPGYPILVRVHVPLDASQVGLSDPIGLEPHAAQVIWEDDFDRPSPRSASNSIVDDDDNDDEEEEATVPRIRGRVLTVLESCPRMVLLGPPGAGKTTTLRYIAWDRAQRLLERSELGPCPLFIELRHCRPTAGASVLDLARSLVEDPRFDANLDRGHYLLLLDGLNEVPAGAELAVRSDIERLIAEHPSMPVVLTTRPTSYRNELELPTFVLEALSDSQIEQYLQRAFSTTEEGRRFTAVLRRHERLWEYGRNPLSLRMIVEVARSSGGDLPDNRGKLMERFVGWLLSRDARKRPQTSLPTKELLLARLAFEMRASGMLSKPWTETIKFLGQAIDTMRLAVKSDAFLAECIDNCLLELQGRHVTFAHELYLEYFAAQALVERFRDDPEILERLSTDDRWREPLLLLHGLIDDRDLVRRALQVRRPALAAEALRDAAVVSETALKEIAASAVGSTANELDEIEVLRTLILSEAGALLLGWVREDPARLDSFRRLPPSSLPILAIAHSLLEVIRAIHEQGADVDERSWLGKALVVELRTLAIGCGGSIPAQELPRLTLRAREVFSLDVRLHAEVVRALASYWPALLLWRDRIRAKAVGRTAIFTWVHRRLKRANGRMFIRPMLELLEREVLSDEDSGACLTARFALALEGEEDERAKLEVRRTLYRSVKAACRHAGALIATERRAGKLVDIFTPRPGASAVIFECAALVNALDGTIPWDHEFDTDLRAATQGKRHRNPLARRFHAWLSGEGGLAERIVGRLLRHAEAERQSIEGRLGAGRQKDQVQPAPELFLPAPAAASSRSNEAAGALEAPIDARTVRDDASRRELNRTLRKQIFLLEVAFVHAERRIAFLASKAFKQQVYYKLLDGESMARGDSVEAEVRVTLDKSKNRYGFIASSVTSLGPRGGEPQPNNEHEDAGT